jgi:hypothetical protein
VVPGGARFDHAQGFFDFRDAPAAAFDFHGHAQSVLQRRAAGGFGFGRKLRDLLFQKLPLLHGMAMAGCDRRVMESPEAPHGPEH